jgi:manganese/iron transport system permease protein
MLGLPFALGAFLAGGLAALAMLFLSERSGLKIDTIIGIIFTSFFGLGLFMMSLWPMSVSIQTIVFGNILSVTPEDKFQLLVISIVTLSILMFRWKDLMVTFFDEDHARSVGLNPVRLKLLFFMLLSASVVAAMKTVGAFLVIAMVITPGATAYLICDRFPRLIAVSVMIGVVTSVMGTYISFFLDGATGGVIVTLQLIIFLITFVIAPKYGWLASRRKARVAMTNQEPV